MTEMQFGNPLDRESAAKEFDRWVKDMRLDLDLEGLDENDRRDTERDCRIITRAIAEGQAIVDDVNQLQYMPYSENFDEAICFKRPKGSAFTAMDKKKKNADFGKIYASVGDMTGLAPKRLTTMDYDDTKFCMSVATLFLA